MSESLQPFICQIQIAEEHIEYLNLHLGFSMINAVRPGDLGLSRAIAKWPHIECKAGMAVPALMMAGGLQHQPWQRYTPEDLALLESSPESRTVFCEAYTDGIVPCWLQAAEIFAKTKHLMDDPGFDMLNTLYGPSGIDFKSFLGVCWVVFYQLGAFANAWRSVLQTWSMGQFAVMQPIMPNPTPLVIVLTYAMLGSASKKESELSGASSFSSSVAMADALTSGSIDTSET
jgi:hypothetical protein